MEDAFNHNLKSLLDKVGNRWVILPNLEIFDQPNDPVVKRHMDDLKWYIRTMPKPYTAALFEKVKAEREKELREIRDRENKGEKISPEEKINAGTETAKKEVEDSRCFSLGSKVILADGKRVKMSQLSIGDKVCCGEENGKLIFSEIYAVVHADNQTATQYQRINYLNADGTEGNK